MMDIASKYPFHASHADDSRPVAAQVESGISSVMQKITPKMISVFRSTAA